MSFEVAAEAFDRFMGRYSRRAAGRPKDLLALEEIGALREELDRRQMTDS